MVDLSTLTERADGPDPEDRQPLEPGCTRCPLAADRECISWGVGPLEAAVMVVGEAPGYGDPNPESGPWRGGNWTGMAYTSRHSGRRIRGMLEHLGYDAYYTNAVKCFPADPTNPTTNREPTADERETCRSHLLEELSIVDPTVVVTTGKHATQSVLAAEGRRLEGFLETVLESQRCDRLDVWLLPLVHPSYQDVWIARLGYDLESYLGAIEAALETVV